MLIGSGHSRRNHYDEDDENFSSGIVADNHTGNDKGTDSDSTFEMEMFTILMVQHQKVKVLGTCSNFI